MDRVTESSGSPRRLVLITGASTGIGLALARTFLADGGFRVVATARLASMDRFDEAGLKESEHLRLCALDVTNSEDRRRLVDGLEEEGGVDVLINNAGISYRSVVEHMSDWEEHLQMNTNFLGPMALVRLVLPGMRRRRRGHIINISSVSGMVAMPTMSSYSASKFALEGATESLWYEMRPWGVHVTLIQPGFVHSNSFRKVIYSRQAARSQPTADDYAGYYAAMAPFVERLMGYALATPESIARKTLRTTTRRQPRLRVAATIDAFIFYLLRRLLPRWIYHRFLYLCLPRLK